MKSLSSACALAVTGVVLIVGATGLARAADPDWKAVEQALGKSGQIQAGDVFRIGMPRTDLAVSVKGVPVKAGFALGSYAAFKQAGDHAMVMGDLVLLDQEVPAVMSGLLALLGQRRRGEACPGLEGGAGPYQQPEVGERTDT